ncbi:MAG: rhomboid family intramembrane serine protease [Bacteroidota bacterium]
MVSSIWEDIKRQFTYGDMLIRIILVNVGIFFAVNLLNVFLWLFLREPGREIYEAIMTWLQAGPTWWHNLSRPWTIITYMFLHEGVWHILMNMLFLFWFGRVVKDLGGNQRILPIYLLGGLVGFVAYVLSYYLFPGYVGPYMLGASAGVMAIVVAAATLAPDYRFHLIFIGPVALKYLAAIIFLLDIISLPKGNTGGHFAHIGGALMGYYFVTQLRSGNDLSVRVNNILEGVVNYFRYLGNMFSGKDSGSPKKNKSKSRMRRRKPSHKSDEEGLSDQEKLDSILEKIKRSGYQSLTEEEKDFLFRASKNE